MNPPLNVHVGGDILFLLWYVRSLSDNEHIFKISYMHDHVALHLRPIMDDSTTLNNALKTACNEEEREGSPCRGV